MNRDDKTMLALAAVTYRGFGKHSEAAIGRALRPWLAKLGPEGLGNWELVWGPASFRARGSLVDDAMVYVARQQDIPVGAPASYAVAIRGTNPISLFDWVFGDLWVRLQTDWSGKTSAGKVSASTALGLAITQHLGAEVPPSEGNRLARFSNELSSAFESVIHALPALPVDRLLSQPELLSDAAVLARLQALTSISERAVTSTPARKLLGFFDEVAQPFKSAFERRLFDKVMDGIVSVQDPGETLLGFLNRTVPQGATVAVTGHSKGGALAIATALWLHEVWAPQRQARIDCYSFAGPTPGNATFAQHYNSQLAARTRRIVNDLDIVPHAWAVDDLRALQHSYPALGPAIALLSATISPLGYTHVAGAVVSISSRKEKRNLIEEAIHQHLDAYLADAQFRDAAWSARSLFLDASAAP